MTDLLRLVSGGDRQTSPGRLSADDVQCVWASVSAYIERQLALNKGVHVAGLGSFTFSQQKLHIGHKFTLVQRPIFILSGKLMQSLSLKQARPLAVATHVPVVQLNFAAVSQDSPFSRDVVEGCVRDTLLLLFRALASEKHVLLPFEGIGVLSFKNNKVQMKFKEDFIKAMDGSGKLLLAFNKSPGSSASLMSAGLSRLQRPQTANPITLPTVCPPSNRAADKDGQCFPPASDQRNTKEVPQQSDSKSHQSLQPAKMKAVSVSEHPTPNPPMEPTDKSSMSGSLRQTPKLEDAVLNVTCSGHSRAGQELCYLCMQRTQRNVPVYLREQQQAEEKAQEQLLLLREQQKDKQYMEEQQAKLNEQREHAKQIAKFNIHMSGKKEETRLPLYLNSFIFPTRPLTPPRRIQQHHYMSELERQIGDRRKHEAEDQQSRLLMERLDHVQLIQEIALQKAQQIQQKQEKTQHYKKALDAQVGVKKCFKPPECQPDESQFSRCETAVNNAESRDRAQKVFQVNFSTATQRKKDELQNRQLQLEKESEMLRRGKMELILDRISRFEKKRDISKSLKNEWCRSARLKHMRDEEERRFLRSAGQLLVDKIAEYRRCCQCQRKTTNMGETNIWKDSNYLSGSQFMI
ncbi:coiled-coil domain-containing protein 81 isoform X2 [Salarias fasciatus]|uniref:Coiled-coil domain containing 81 n=1 Tax=Salarias fasciatus TaxID=181472 RepID=A0A672G3P4_SALFA|nr:coiled-coil domain-containing protein 81 isoform X2 [Salarias fasciatus]